MDGAAFLTEHLDVEPIWGEGSRVLAAKGEPTLLTGPQGVGKSTVAQQYALARMGLGSTALDHAVEEGGRVLYLAMDRPTQIQRSLARMIDADNPKVMRVIGDLLHVWRGALPVDPAADPALFAEWVQDEGGEPDTIVVDSYKDVGGGALSDESVAYNINQASQLVCASGTEWLGLHHHRKGQGNQQARPNRLDDVYGSTWLTSGTGSVLMLWGEPGAARVELIHLKQPMDPVSMLVDHEHMTGVSSSVDPEADLIAAAQKAGTEGVTDPRAAVALYGSSETADRKKARRVLDRLTRDGVLEHKPGMRGGSGGGGRSPRWWVA